MQSLSGWSRLLCIVHIKADFMTHSSTFIICPSPMQNSHFWVAKDAFTDRLNTAHTWLYRDIFSSSVGFCFLSVSYSWLHLHSFSFFCFQTLNWRFSPFRTQWLNVSGLMQVPRQPALWRVWVQRHRSPLQPSIRRMGQGGVQHFSEWMLGVRGEDSRYALLQRPVLWISHHGHLTRLPGQTVKSTHKLCFTINPYSAFTNTV